MREFDSLARGDASTDRANLLSPGPLLDGLVASKLEFTLCKLNVYSSEEVLALKALLILWPIEEPSHQF